MTGPARLEIDATEEHVVVARAFVVAALIAHGAAEDDVMAARLAVSELVTAFVRGASTRVVVTVPAADRVEIVDEQAPTPDALVMRIASSVADIESVPGGFHVLVGPR